ncbi:recombinase family protein [Enterovirga rhinocerotis]|uniref:DNA invertase Pin-like site-specific DNA recombinase n=1 Tax=Enterovirga rhinocerotis TaxID=1339210 RepID=A0A4R7C7E2_9HYPH|nr:recombinase family protein [Enterovirga rhinocerotis]TDR94191.1 DNA invertase Pin-like site-specific DNA recombinase [Enterovirga rhinocerotis]
MAGSARAARKLARAKSRQASLQASSRRAVGYCRVSTEEQAAHGFGLEIQESAIRAFAVSQGYEMLEVLADRGISGATLPAERQAFGRILEMAREGGFVLLVWKFDRLARNLRHAITTVHDELLARDIELRSVTEAAIDTGSPMGRMIFAIFAGMAEGERETITLRTKSGRIAKGRKGGLACGSAPLGYRRREDGTLQVVEGEARLIRLIFALREDGLLLRQIADRLNADGHRGLRGGLWRPGTVQYVLENEKYRGALEWVFEGADGAIEHVHVPGAVEAIVCR